MSLLFALIAYFGFGATPTPAPPATASLAADTGTDDCAVDDSECIAKRKGGPIVKY